MSNIALIAGDSDFERALLLHALEGQDYKVFETRNGQECLQQYQQLCPDIVLLDCIMPVMDGYSCCEALREQSETEHMPIVMLSNREDSASIQRAFDSGATDYILKPIQWNIFFKRINQLVKQATLMRQLAHQNEEYQQATMVDDLTQVLNRRAFDQSLEKEWKRGLRDAKPLSILLIDVDCFDVYNDASGNVAADQPLQQIAKVISNAIYRSSDVVCRFGDKEFGILLPNTFVEGAIHVVTRVQKAIKDNNPSMTKKPITLNYGLSSLVPSQAIELTQLLEAADTALLKAKSKGRNCIEVHSLETVEPLIDRNWL
jgi:diguanylate cyclase (GGDEF)-like protein